MFTLYVRMRWTANEVLSSPKCSGKVEEEQMQEIEKKDNVL